jgi:hypothetical protein
MMKNLMDELAAIRDGRDGLDGNFKKLLQQMKDLQKDLEQKIKDQEKANADRYD